MEQNRFDFDNPIHHRDDPSTSVDAAEEVISSGRRESHAQKIFRFICNNPHLTTTEISDGLPELNLYAVRRRVSDLKDKKAILVSGQVARGGQRRQETYYENPDPPEDD